MEMVNKEVNGAEMTVRLSGRLDTAKSPEVLSEIESDMNTTTKLTIDLKELIYISSSGLRILLQLQKEINAKKGSMVIKNPSAEIMNVFAMTGFDQILKIE